MSRAELEVDGFKATWQRLRKGGTWPPEFGPWHLVRRRHGYRGWGRMPGDAECGAVLYRRRRDDAPTATAPAAGDKVCPKCRRDLEAARARAPQVTDNVGYWFNTLR